MAKVDIQIGANTTKAERGLNRLRQRVDKFSSGVAGRLGAAFATGAIIAGLRGLVNELDRIDKLSKRGFSTDFLQDLSRQAELSGANLETAVNGMGRLVKEINAANGPTALIADEIQALGLSVSDLRGKSPEQLFNIISQTIGGLASESDQLAAANTLLGRSGQELLPLFQALYQEGGLKEGAKTTEEGVKAAADLNDMFTEMTTTLKSYVMPVLLFLLGTFKNLIRIFNFFGDVIGTVINLAIGQFDNLKRTAMDVATALTNIFSHVGDMFKAIFTLDRDALKNSIKAMTAEVAEQMEKTWNETKDNASDAFGEIGKDFDKLIKDMDKNFEASIGNAPDKKDDKKDDREATGVRNTKEPEEPEDKEPKELTEREDSRIAREKKQKEGQERAKRLMDDEQGLLGSIEKLRETIGNPSNTVASSLQAVGGGGTVYTPQQNKQERLLEKQLSKLDEIRDAISRTGIMG